MAQARNRPQVERIRAATPEEVTTFRRRDFLDNVWDYRSGDHVTFVGRTRSGKTTLAFQLLSRIPEDIVPIVLVMKPRDATVVDWTQRLKYKRTATWPPLRSARRMPRNYKPPGWVAWPNLGNIESDDAITRDLFHKVMADSYAQAARRGAEDRIIFADEIVGIAKELRLERDVNALWMRGGGMGVGLWAGAQRPFELPQHALSQSVHLFLHRDDDKRNRERFAEIGGVDPDFVMQLTSSMAQYQFLYIARRGYHMAIVDAR
jgi:hypothetical protein